jgi:hypothetical protein
VKELGGRSDVKFRMVRAHLPVNLGIETFNFPLRTLAISSHFLPIPSGPQRLSPSFASTDFGVPPTSSSSVN